ncbi:CoA pyrophosphatase [Ignavibacteria bacterium]|nr:CoA pyrophosphatase [Bacteroidota bacterium]
MEVSYQVFTEFLRERLQRPLPGFAAHSRMLPTRFSGMGLPPAPPNAKRSAVLVLLHNDGGSPTLLLTLRSTRLKSHRGQISFPGGRIEVGETPEAAALRETSEEIGIVAPVTLLGRLSTLYVPPSNSLITPIVGALQDMPALILQSDEVDEAFSLRIGNLLAPGTMKPARLMKGDAIAEAPYWDAHPTTPLWGATAMIVSELLTLYEECAV